MNTHQLDSTAVNPGEIVAGKYRVERLLASGGMGQVMVATHLELDQLVALKLMRAELMGDDTLSGRFRREARAAAKLTSEHVVRVYDVGELDDGTPYIVLEYLDGTPLTKVINTRAPLPIEEAVDIVLQALAGVAEAHAAGIVHRDLKPDNLFVTHGATGRSVVKVLDFGISKFKDDARRRDYDGTEFTVEQTVLGTPAYMSPEQVEDARDVDGRTDIWSMGVILHELLTGKRLFRAESPASMYAKILRDPIPAVSATHDGVPAALEAILARCLARLRDERYASAGELAAALLPFSAATPTVQTGRARPSSTPTPRDPESGTLRSYDTPALEGAPRPLWRSPRALVLVALFLGVAVLIWITRGPEVPAASTAAASAPSRVPPATPASAAPTSPPVSSTTSAIAPSVSASGSRVGHVPTSAPARPPRASSPPPRPVPKSPAADPDPGDIELGARH